MLSPRKTAETDPVNKPNGSFIITTHRFFPNQAQAKPDTALTAIVIERITGSGQKQSKLIKLPENSSTPKPK